MTIHQSHPFADVERDAGRQFRGRLGARVSIWTAGQLGTPSAAGLTVSSMMLAAGEPWRVLALLDPMAELTERLIQTERAIISLLAWDDRHLAEVFAGLAPAPGGKFTAGEFVQEEAGPRLISASTWASVELESVVEVGWSQLVTCRIETAALGHDEVPLHHVRGRFVGGPTRPND